MRVKQIVEMREWKRARLPIWFRRVMVNGGFGTYIVRVREYQVNADKITRRLVKPYIDYCLSPSPLYRTFMEIP